MTLIHTQRNFAHDNPHESNVSHVRHFNGGGFSQGIAREAGRYGGQFAGVNGNVFGGVLGVQGDFALYAEVEDVSGAFYPIVSDPVIAGQANRRFILDPAVQGQIPRKSRVWVRVDAPGAVTIYWYLFTS